LFEEHFTMSIIHLQRGIMDIAKLSPNKYIVLLKAYKKPILKLHVPILQRVLD